MRKSVLYVIIGGLMWFSSAKAVNAATVMEKALELANQGRIEEAATVLDVRLRTIPEDTNARVLLSRLYDYDGDPNRAIETLKSGLAGKESDLDLLAELYSLYVRMGDDGPTVSYKRGAVTYSPSKDKEKEEAFKREHLRLAVNVCEKALEIMPDASYFSFQLGQTLTKLEEFERALKIFEKLTADHPEEPAFIAALSPLYFSQGMTNQALKTLEKTVELDPKAVEAHRTLAELQRMAGRNEQADLHERMADFYGWIPVFIDVPYSDANYKTYQFFAASDTEDDADAEKKMFEQLADDGSAAALGFLAVLCYQHGNHGELENLAFAALEKHPKDGAPLLLLLLENGQSICTIRQAAYALASLKAEDAVDPMIAMLPSDVRFLWISNVAECLARIGNDKAVPALLQLADVNSTLEKPEDDPMNGFTGRIYARYRAIVALGAFARNKDAVLPELKAGTENPQVASACYAGLYRLTGDETYLARCREAAKKNDEYSYSLLCTLRNADNGKLNALADELDKDDESDETGN